MSMVLILPLILMNLSGMLDLQVQPIKYKRDACTPYIFDFEYNSIKLSAKPRGVCQYCCNVSMKKDVRLMLYTKDIPEGRLLSTMKVGTLAKAGLKANEQTIIYIHGFLEVGTMGISAKSIRNAYLGRKEWFNVIIVDWSGLSCGPWYIQASKNTRLVGSLIGMFLDVFNNSDELPLENVHLVGFSLGAHAAGFAGQYMKQKGFTLKRITGLDPAFPLFSTNETETRLSNDDAELVDIIHTNPIFLGYPTSIGDVDFYPNAGMDFQPGCYFRDVLQKRKIDDFLSCSHQKAWLIYSQSVENPERFPAIKCKTFKENHRGCADFDSNENVLMGFPVSRNVSGNFVAVTN